MFSKASVSGKLTTLDPAQFSLPRHGQTVQSGDIFFVSKSVGVGPNDAVLHGGGLSGPRKVIT